MAAPHRLAGDARDWDTVLAIAGAPVASADTTVTVNTQEDVTIPGDNKCSLPEAAMFVSGSAGPDCASARSGTTTIGTMMRGATARIASVLAVLIVAGGCGGSPKPRPPDMSGIPGELLRESRPIGRGPRFQPPVRGPVTGACRPRLGPRRGVHVELFAANRVVIVARGIGVRAPLSFSGGRIVRAGCYGDVVTLEPTGVVLVRAGRPLRLRDLFRAWGQPLSRRRLASFTAPAGTQVAVFVNGRRRRGPPQSVLLRAHDEIVLEVGPFVAPHRTYTFPPGA